MTQQKPTSKPPSKEEFDQAKKELDEACDAAEAAAKKHAAAVKRTTSDPKLKAVRLPTPSQMELEAAPATAPATPPTQK